MKGFIVLLIFLSGCHRHHVRHHEFRKVHEPKRHGELAITGDMKEMPGGGYQKGVSVSCKLTF